MARQPLDWPRLGRNVRQARIIRGFSQEQFARKADISITTLYRVEQGLSISHRSFLKICTALEESFDSMRTRNRAVLTQSVDCLVFRRATGIWTVELDTRTKVPEDDLLRIQEPLERLRLGRLGLVSVFFCTTDFIMPAGPGLVLIELYRNFADPFNATIYRDCLISCSSGGARVQIGETIVELQEGDVVGYRSKDLRWMEPLETVGPTGSPTLLTWTGAVRVGSGPDEDARRVKRRRRSVVP